jgi:hypothetical protein
MRGGYSEFWNCNRLVETITLKVAITRYFLIAIGRLGKNQQSGSINPDIIPMFLFKKGRSGQERVA